METALPRPASILGPAGLIPFAGLALGSLLGWPWAPAALAAYGATILAFLGAVHWGLALRAPDGERWAEWGRIGLGVLPSLLAWVALLLPLPTGLVVLAAGVLATAAVETWATARGLVPRAYLKLRWILSAGAALALLLARAAV